MSTQPMTLGDAADRGLLTDRGIYTFSNGDHWECWAARNCVRCAHWVREEAGLCAFDAAAFLGKVSPALAILFGWTQDAEYDKPDDHRHGWDEPEQCACFRARDERDDDPPPAPEPDPTQLVLIADPTEDAARFASSPSRDRSPTLVGRP